MKVLVIDDSKMITTLVMDMLVKAGHTASHCENGQVAIDLLVKKEKFDLILLDWNMPVLDGPGFLKEFSSKAFEKTPIVMMTTENKPAMIKEALSLGACEYIMKPFTSDILISKLAMINQSAEGAL